MAEPSPVKLAVQRTARRLERAMNDQRTDIVAEYFSPDFAGRDNELVPLLAETAEGELIGTVANRTVFQLRRTDADDRVVELLWRERDGRWLIEDCRVFSLIPGE
jgi:phage host-nuclease inhibitor protein Gam